MRILTDSHGFLERRDQNSLQAQADQSHDAAEITDKLGLFSLRDRLRNTPLLVFANKQDLPNAMNAAEKARDFVQPSTGQNRS